MTKEMPGSPGNAENSYPGDCEFIEFLHKKTAARSECAAISKEALFRKAAKVELLLLDVDGVLTNGSITYTHQGDEIKTFHCRDGFGINILRKAGVEVGLITARTSESLLRRAKDLSLTHVFQGVRNKVECYAQLLDKLSFEPSQVAFMGDDWLDLPLLTKVGLATAVADCAPELKAVVHFVSNYNGGTGAVRELCDLIIEAKGMRETLLSEYLNRH